MITFFIYIFCAIFILLLSIIAILEERSSRIHQMFACFGVGIVGWIGSIFFTHYLASEATLSYSICAARLAYGMSILFPLFLALFFYNFPKRTFNLSKYIKGALVIETIALAVMAIFTPLIHLSHEAPIVAETYLAGPLYPVYLLHILVYLVLAAGFALKKFSAVHGIEKNKLRLAAGGLFVFYFIGMVTNVILPAFGIYILLKESVAFTLFFIIPAFYAIQRFRFFNLTFLSLKYLRRGLLLGIFLLVVVILYEFLARGLPHISGTINAIISAGLGLAVIRRLEKVFPEFVSSGFREFRSAMTELMSEIYYCDDYKKLRNLIEKLFIVKLHVKSAQLYVLRDKHVKMKIPVYVKDNFTKALASFKKELLVTDEINFLKLPERTKKVFSRTMKKLEGEVCLPLFAEDSLIGFLILGSKSNKQHYAKEEIKEILSIRPNLQTAFMNILLKKNLQEENNLMKAAVRRNTGKLKEHIKDINGLLLQQSEFISTTAHEFRTPLSIALFQVEDTLKKHKGSKGVLEDMKTMGKSLQNLKSLMQSLFEVQQYDLNKAPLEKTKVKIRAFLKDIQKEFKPLAKERSIKFSLEDSLKKEVTLNLDPAQIRRVLYNLITNAFKFVDKKEGEVLLAASKEGKDVVIKVIDNGTGVPAKLKKSIFEKFQTEKGKTGTGMGLGLYLCSKIIESHEGKIWLEDSKPSGATFCIKLSR